MNKIRARVFHIRAGEGDGLLGDELERRLNEWLASLDQRMGFKILNIQQTVVLIDGGGCIVYTILYEIHQDEESSC